MISSNSMQHFITCCYSAAVEGSLPQDIPQFSTVAQTAAVPSPSKGRLVSISREQREPSLHK